MDLFRNGSLNPLAFDYPVRQASRDLAEILFALGETQSARVESTHLLLVLARIPDGVTQRSLQRRRLTPDQWRDGLAQCVRRAPGTPPPPHLTPDSLDETARAALEDAAAMCQQLKATRITEPFLLMAALRRATPEFRELCDTVQIDLEAWCRELEDAVRPVETREVLGRDGAVMVEQFTPFARKVLTVMCREAEALKYDVADPRHLLLALLIQEGGATHSAIYHEDQLPRKVQEAVTLSLRGRAGHTPTVVPLDREHLQPLLQHLLAEAGQLAAREHAAAIGERHLLQALLATDSSARRILQDVKLDIAGMLAFAERSTDPEPEVADDPSAADIETVTTRLLQRLVGQDDAVKRIVPYVQRMRFGFATPGHPVGVFLFCGQSGCGKTEMAKELARAVYGSEDNLIMLEMGQLNSPESMNIFVGAPPGYVGYGEGKLTNGLRDKPRAVVLFDEVEKAHARVLDALLRFLDEGRIDDPAGPVRDGSQCIVILTSNVASEQLGALWGTIATDPNWRVTVREQLREEFRKHEFRVEFLNRVDELILFRSLEEKDYVEIAARAIATEVARLSSERAIVLTVAPVVAKLIGEYCGAVNEGARSVHRMVRTLVITPVIGYLVENQVTPPATLRVSARRDGADKRAEPIAIVEG